MQRSYSVYPTYSLSEQIVDGIIHLLGVTGAIAGAVMLVMWSLGNVSGAQGTALAVYGLTLIATFVASAFYHMTPWETLRPILRRIDHAAIYLKIAGTYTPLVFIIGSISSYLVLGLVWVLAILGAVQKLVFWQKPGRVGPFLYLILGWISVTILWQIIPLVPMSAVWLIVSGGLLYSFGVIFYKWQSLKFSNAIWHGFVAVASGCFYIAIAISLHDNLS